MRMGGPIQVKLCTTHADCGSKESSRLVSTGPFGLPGIDEAHQLHGEGMSLGSTVVSFGV